MRNTIAWVFIAGVLLILGYFVASASSPFDIEFPIPELGSCVDKDACRAYCDDGAHAVECLEFARKYGLAGGDSVEKARAAQEGGPGGCQGQDACHAYCNDPAHETECVEFAVGKGFMTREEADRILRPGPGGCRARACEAYCHDPAHEEECFEYAVANGLIPKEEAERIKQFKEKFKTSQGGPGGCRGDAECRSYCEDPAHIDECLRFAEEHGVVDKGEAVRFKKAGLAGGPGGCRGQEACHAYCEVLEHQVECIEFGEKNGFMSKEEAERARKFAGKGGPGGCRGPDECRAFCENPANTEQCLEHAEREGLMPKEEVQRARKFMKAAQEGGPGGCRGQQCRDYCETEDHQQECFQFAKTQGLISEEEEKHFEAGQKIQQVMEQSGGPGGCRNDNECREYCSSADHVEECVAFGAAHGGVPPEQVREMLKQFTERRFEARGDFGGPQDDFRRFEQESQKRFEEFRMLEQEFRGKFPSGGFPQGGFPGGPPSEFPGSSGEFPGRPGEFPPDGHDQFPGGGGFPGGQGGPVFLGPGGCSSPAECIQYCTTRKEECFGGPTSGPSPAEEVRGSRGPQGGFGFPGRPPQLRGGLLQEFKPDELPQGFEQLPPEEREKLFHQNFPQFNPPSPGQFPSSDPSQRPRQSQEFPAGTMFPSRSREFPSQDTRSFPGSPDAVFPGQGEGFPSQFPREDHGRFPIPFPTDGQFPIPRPTDGQFPVPGPTDGPFPIPLPTDGPFPIPTNGQFPIPSTGSFPSSGGSFTQPPIGTFPSGSDPFHLPSSGETFTQPPPSGTFMPPPSDSFTPPPLSSNSLYQFFSAVLGVFAR